MDFKSSTDQAAMQVIEAVQPGGPTVLVPASHPIPAPPKEKF